MPKIHSSITDDSEIHLPKGFAIAANETALIKGLGGALEYRSVSELGATGPAGPAGTTLVTVAVASINSPTELSAETGTVQGDIILVFEAVVSGPNPFATYTWDTDAGSNTYLNPPFTIPATGGVWVNTGSGFHQGRLGLDQVSASDFHGSFRHVHREGRSYFLHAGSPKQLLSRVGYDRSVLTGTEVDFFEQNEDVYKTKTLSSNTTLTFVGYQHGDIRYLEIDSAAGETLAFPAYVNIFGEYNTTGTVNYITLNIVDEGTFATGTVTVDANVFDASDTVTVNGTGFVIGTDWFAGADVSETAWNIGTAISDSNDSNIRGKVNVSVSGAVITIIDRIGGLSGNAVTLAVTDGATPNFTVSGATLSGGIDGQVLARIEQIGPVLPSLTAISSASTGLLEGGEITINAGDNTKFDLAAGTARFVDAYTDPLNPTLVDVSFGPFVAVTVTNLATQGSTEIMLDNTGSIVQATGADFTGRNLRAELSLGSVAHPSLVQIDFVIDAPFGNAVSPGNSLTDLSIALGAIVPEGNIFSANGANLSIDKSAGKTFFLGTNLKVDPQDPNLSSQAGLTVASFILTFRDGVGGFNNTFGNTVIVPGSYDDGDGVLGSVGNNQWAIWRVFISTTNDVLVFYPQAVYASSSDAQAVLQTEAVFDNPDFAGAIFRSWIVVKGNATDLSNSAQALFFSAGRFGNNPSAGSTSTTSMQQAYDNGTEPEIVVSVTRGALSIQDNPTPLAAPLFEVQSNGGAVSYLEVSADELKTETQAYSDMDTLTDAATITTDCALGNVHEVTLAGNRTLGAPTNLKDGATYIWIFTQDVVGTRTLAFNAVFLFPAGDTPILSTPAASVDILTGVSDGTNVFCTLTKGFS